MRHRPGHLVLGLPHRGCARRGKTTERRSVGRWLSSQFDAEQAESTDLDRLDEAARGRTLSGAQWWSPHLADPALAARLLGVDVPALLDDSAPDTAVRRPGPLLGALFESLVTLSVRVYATVLIPSGRQPFAGRACGKAPLHLGPSRRARFQPPLRRLVGFADLQVGILAIVAGHLDRFGLRPVSRVESYQIPLVDPGSHVLPHAGSA